MMPTLCLSQAFMGDLQNKIEAERVARGLQGAASALIGPAVLQDGISFAHLLDVQEKLMPSLAASPGFIPEKLKMGENVGQERRISLPSAFHAVQRYFLWHHGIALEGFQNGTEAAFGALTKLGAPDAHISMLRSFHQKNWGVLPSDMVALTVFIERVLHGTGIDLLRRAYKVNKFGTDQELSSVEVQRVFEAWIYHWVQGTKVEDVDRQEILRHRYQPALATWKIAMDIAHSHMVHFWWSRAHSTNPFKVVNVDDEMKYSFDDVIEILGQVILGFGKDLGRECVAVQEFLHTKDVEKTGRISIDNFHRLRKFSIWQFTEDADALNQIGAVPLNEKLEKQKLDWRIKGGKNQVIVTNYLQAHDNCILKGDKYSVCCPNQCESLLTALENKFGEVAANPRDIWKVLQELAPITASGGSWASNTLGSLNRLQQMAKEYDGMVPLHSVDFAYFLHFAFPQDCPIPRKDARGVSSTAVPLTPADVVQIAERKETPAVRKDVTYPENASVAKSGASTWDRVMRDEPNTNVLEEVPHVKIQGNRIKYLGISTVGLIALVGLGLLHQKVRRSDAKEKEFGFSSGSSVYV
jgi:hypothetical protein